LCPADIYLLLAGNRDAVLAAAENGYVVVEI
jgi:hypothetical protein